MSIRVGGKHRNLVRFRDEIAAAENYDEVAREFFGEYAQPNSPMASTPLYTGFVSLVVAWAHEAVGAGCDS